MSDHHHGTINHDTSEPYIKAIVWGVLITTAFTLFMVKVGLEIHKSMSSHEKDQKENVSDTADVKSLRAEEQVTLTQYTLTDKAKGTVVLPIAVAMDRVVAAYQGQK